MSRLIVLSNRVKMPDHNPMAGGLAIALHDLLKANSGIWMGWNGDIINNDHDAADDCDHCRPSFLTQTESGSSGNLAPNSTVTYMTTGLSAQQYQHFYCGFANNVLWPLLHERVDLICQAPQDYSEYQAVNRRFAQQLKKISQPDDVIWVHDYHFLSVAYYCRQLGMRNRIGFFLHIPFVKLAHWQALEQSAELIHHLAHYDVLGTQTQQDKANCSAVIQHYLKNSLVENCAVKKSSAKNSSVKTPCTNALCSQPMAAPSDIPSPNSLTVKINLAPTSVSDFTAEHCLKIKAYPIGVNVAKIQQQVSHLSGQSLITSQKNSPIKSAAQQIIAVDRIDYSKGLLARFSAYQSFLQQYPNYQNQLQLLQIACPSRLDLPIYQQLYDEVRQAVTQVNQHFMPTNPRPTTLATTRAQTIDLADHPINLDECHKDHDVKDWQAVTYSENVLGHDALMSAFWHSDVGWVNSLKDGMNLVAKEYVAAQNPDNPGVLLLSRYAGAAEQMQEAIIIDPLDPKDITQGLKTALTMPLAERKSRYHSLFKGLQQHDLQAWQQDFLKDLYHG